MRVLYVVHGFPPRVFTGTESYTCQTARAVAATHEVGVFYTFKDPQQEIFAHEEKEQDGMRCWGVNFDIASQARNFARTWHTPQVARAFRDCLAAFDPDIVHFTYLLGGLSIEQALDAKKSGAKVVVTLTDFLPLCPRGQLLDYENKVCTGPESARKCARCIWLARSEGKSCPLVAGAIGLFASPLPAKRRRAIVAALSAADCVITPTAALAEQYRRWMPEIGRSKTLGFGIDTGLFENFHRERAEKIRFGFIGQLLPHKGLHVLLDAAPKDGCDIVVFGGTNLPGSAEYVANLKKKHTAENIHWRGTFPHEEIAEAFTQFDVLAVPSIWYENSPLVVLYAKQTRTPMIVSDCGGLTEFVRDGETGLIVPPGNAGALAGAMQRFIDEPGLLDAMTDGIIAPMDTRTHARRLMEIYEAVAR